MTKRLSTLVGATLLRAAGALPAATVKVDAVPGGTVNAAAVVARGSSFAVDILVSGAADLAGFQFDLTFDPAILAATGIVSGGVFDPDTFGIASSLGSGTLSFAEITLGSGVNILADTLIATLRFSALNAGNTALSLGNVILSDGLAAEIGPLTLTGATVGVAAAPLPGTALLLGAGLLTLARRRA